MPQFAMEFTANTAPLEAALQRVGATARKVGEEIVSIPVPVVPQVASFSAQGDLAEVNAATARLEALAAANTNAGILAGSIKSQGGDPAAFRPQIYEAAGLTGATGLGATEAEIAAGLKARSSAQGTFTRIANTNPELTQDEIAERTRLSKATKGTADAQELQAEAIAKANLKMQENIGVLNEKISTDTKSGELAREEAALRGRLAAVKQSEYDAAFQKEKIEIQATAAAAQNLTIYEFEAQIAAEQRAEAIKFGAAKQEAYARQIFNDEEIANLAAQEKASREVRLALEKSHAAKALQGDIAPLVGEANNVGVTGTTIVGASQADQAKTDALIAAAKQEELAGDEAYIAAKTKSAALEKENNAIIEGRVKAELAVNDGYLAAKQQIVAATLLEKENLIALVTAEDIERTGYISAQSKINADLARSAELEVLSTEEALQVKAQRILAEKEYSLALRKATAEEVAANGGGILAQAQARFGGGRNDGTASGIAGGGALGLITQALPAVAGFAVIGGLAASIKEAESLQKVMVQLHAELDSFGKGDQFSAMSKGILDIAASTGSASTQVATLAFQFLGAFGGNTQATIENTKSALEGIKITGLDSNAALINYRALTQAFQSSNVTIEQLNNTALGLQERFGVTAKETLTFAASVAEVGSQAGFTYQELETMGAALEQVSHKGAAANAESINRIIPNLQTNAVSVVKFFDGINSNVAKQLGADFGAGDTAAAFKTLEGSFKGLTSAQQQYLAEAIATKRDAPAIIALFAQYDKQTKSLADGQNDAGKQAAYFAAQQATLAQKLADLGETLKQVGISFFNAGFGQFLTDLAGAVLGIATLLKGVITAFSAVDDAFGGLISKGVGFTLVLAGIVKAASLLGVGFTKLTGIKIADTVATDANTKAVAENTAAEEVNGAAAESAGGARTVGGVAGGVSRAAPLAGDAGAIRTAESAAADAKIVGLGEGGVTVASLGNIERGSLAAGAGLESFGSKAATFAGSLRDAINKIPTGLAVAGAILAIGELINKVNETRGKASQDQGALENQILNSADPQGEINKLRAQQGSYSSFDNFAAGVSGYKTPDDLANNIQAKFDAPGTVNGSQNALDFLKKIGKGGRQDAGLQFNDSALQSVQDDIDALKTNPGDKTASDGLKAFLDKIKERNGNVYTQIVQPGIEAGKATRDAVDNVKRSNDQAVKDFQSSDATLASAKAAYESGEISFAEYKKQSDASLQAFSEITNLDNIKGAADQYAKEKKAIADAISKRKIAAAKNYIDLQKLGGNTDPQGEVSALLPLLNDPEISATDKASTTKDIITALKNVQQAELAAATTAAEKLKILKNGIPIPPEVRASLIQQNLQQFDVAWQGLLLPLEEGFPEIAKSVAEETAHILATTNATVAQATKTALQKQLDELSVAADAFSTQKQRRDAGGYGQIEQEMATIAAQIAGIDTGALSQDTNPAVPTSIKGSPSEIAAAQKQAQSDALALIKAKSDYLKALNSDDPVAVARIALDEANQELASAAAGTKEWYAAKAGVEAANKQLRNALAALGQAEIDYFDSFTFGDAYATALQAKKKADFALSNAHNREEQLKALALENAADQSYKDAIGAIYQSQEDVLIAQDNAAGDTVGAAKEGVKKAQQAYDAIVAKYKNTPGGGTAEVNAAKAALINAQATLQSAQLQAQLDDYQFMFDMGQITKQQFINYLQALRNSVGINEKDRRALDREIKALTGQLGQDLQFNLPTSIGLPTLYEARRLNQTAATGPGNNYDNRTQTVTVIVSNGMTQQQATQVVSDALGGPTRFGNSLRRY